MNADGLYVYAIGPAGALGGELGAGIDGAPVTVVENGQLAAAVHEHDADPFQGADAEVRRWVLEHSQVVEQVWQTAGTVLPVSFNVIVSPGEDEPSGARLRTWLAANAETLSAHLDRLRNRVELRVEITLSQEVVGEHSREITDLHDEVSQRPAGVQRLYRKRIQDRERELTKELADRLYPDFRRRLAALSEDLTESRRQGRTPGAVSVLSASLLVPDQGVDQIGVELADIRDGQPGVEIRYLGPWPPYSFADVADLSSAASTA